MADEVQMRIDEMQSISTVLNTQGDSIAQMLQMIEAKMEDLRPDWIGLGSEAFYEEMESLIIPSIQELDRCLRSGSQTVKTIQANFETADDQAAGQCSLI